jgi:hypothetical protein
MEAEQIIKYIDSFTNIYDKDGNEVNPIPEDKRVTVYCSNGGDTKGFIENSLKKHLGFEALIAKSWILHSELKKLAK